MRTGKISWKHGYQTPENDVKSPGMHEKTLFYPGGSQSKLLGKKDLCSAAVQRDFTSASGLCLSILITMRGHSMKGLLVGLS